MLIDHSPFRHIQIGSCFFSHGIVFSNRHTVFRKCLFQFLHAGNPSRFISGLILLLRSIGFSLQIILMQAIFLCFNCLTLGFHSRRHLWINRLFRWFKRANEAKIDIHSLCCLNTSFAIPFVNHNFVYELICHYISQLVKVLISVNKSHKLFGTRCSIHITGYGFMQILNFLFKTCHFSFVLMTKELISLVGQFTHGIIFIDFAE